MKLLFMFMRYLIDTKWGIYRTKRGRRVVEKLIMFFFSDLRS